MYYIHEMATLTLGPTQAVEVQHEQRCRGRHVRVELLENRQHLVSRVEAGFAQRGVVNGVELVRFDLIDPQVRELRS